VSHRRHGRFCRSGVADVAFNELVGNRMEIREIAGIGELVVVDDYVIVCGVQKRNG